MSLDLIARYYDLLHANFAEDLPMWKTLAEDAPGSLLEVGCGTGRLLLPLAEAGHKLTGIDLSEVALSASRAKLEAVGLLEQVSIRLADMRNFELPDKDYALALVPLNTFMHCHTIAEQLATLDAVHQHLQPAGRVIVDLFHPDPTLLTEPQGHLIFEAETVDDLTGRTVQWYWRQEFDLTHQMRYLTYILDEIDPEGLVRRTQIPIKFRFVHRYEMELLLMASGFALEAVYGSYQLEPFDASSPRMIFVATKVEN